MNHRTIFAIVRGILVVGGSTVLASLVVVLATVLADGQPPRANGSVLAGTFNLFLFATLFSGPFVAAGLVVFGLPVDYLLRRQGIWGAPAYVASGALGGLFLGALVGLPLGTGAIFFLLIGLAYGVVTASLYWFLFPRIRARAP